MKIEITTNEAGQRLDKFLRKLLKDVPLSAIFRALRKGDIRVNGKKGKEKYSLNEGDIVEIKYIMSKKEKKDEKFKEVDPKSLRIIYEDESMALVEKWPGILVHSDKKDGDPTLTDYVLSYLNRKGDYLPEKEVTFTPASCNRLDRNTSGIVFFGKTFEGLKLLNEMIRERKISKYYCALVKGRIKDGKYEAYITKDEENNISQVFENERKNTKKIAMEVKTLESNGAYSLIEINLITGKSHQLRAHLSFLGNPIIGDPKYGDKRLNSFFENKYGLNYQFLYAYKVIFKNVPEKFNHLKNKTIAETLPPIFKKIKRDVFKVVF
ncbi:RluA family pseudouridine synthase [Clostridium fallax]|uniref:Pseudouridine synthase n=1 Tax=Clostridium fallax TaxID=1533 RepID=A0A1M4U4E4_9CLOT|nr:RluA family pseudouridine synthase [Clostridium fallax]SHE51516.1 23S rRNA pseudouridine955/2504/2580 synthase [Clostridium fallax]SQB06071.1 ribosomal large subunit pseudouridine synthase C [Clostridium fallax]